MEQNRASHGFATLGHPGRLAVFRLLMRFAPQSVRPTEIAASLGLKQNTLSHHLADLTACGLVQVERRGRSLHYSVDMEVTEGLIGYLALDVGRARADLLGPLFAHQKEGIAMGDTTFNVLFICSGNSARSIFAEVLLRDLGQGKFQAFSAGVHPNSQLNPFALEVLGRNGHDVAALRSKHLSEFQDAGVQGMDFVFTVCDTAAAEECPPWPRKHWSLRKPTGRCAAASLPSSNCPSLCWTVWRSRPVWIRSAIYPTPTSKVNPPCLVLLLTALAGSENSCCAT
jgi:protein-tyrosine-phosphatase/DNA-binding transcriptional ArsR family regulator